MARTSVTTQKITRAGLTPVLTAPTTGAGNGDVIDVGNVFLMVVATSAAVNVTVQTPLKVDGLDVAELTVAVPTSTTKLIGPLPAGDFARGGGSTDPGRAYVDYDTATGVTRAVVSF